MTSSDQADDGATPAALADLQAGLLDDARATALRHLARTDPRATATLQALDRVRSRLADLDDDPSSAPEVPPEVTARINAALRAAPPHRVTAGAHPGRAAHAILRGAPWPHRLQAVGPVVGLAAAVLAVGLGAAVLLRAPHHSPSAKFAVGETVKSITVGYTPAPVRPAAALAPSQLAGLLAGPPDLGPLSDPQRLASCLLGLGYPAATQILGARPVDENGRPGVLMVLAGTTPTTLTTVVVSPICHSADPGLLTKSVVARP